MKYQNAVEMYLESCKASGKTKETLSGYRRTLDKFGEYLAKNHTENVSDVKTIAIDGFKVERSNQVSATSLNLFLTHLRCFFGWCHDMELVERNPFKKSITVDKSALRIEQSKPYEHIVSEENFRDVIANNHPANMHRSTYARNRAILAVLLTSGIRCTSLSRITPNDLDAENNTIHLSCAKGGKSGEILYSDIAQKAVKEYLASGYRPNTCKRSDPLFGFVDENGKWKAYSREHLSEIVCASFAGFTGVQGYHSHAMRHGFATILANNGLRDQEISILLMHSGDGPAVTKRYIQRSNKELFAKANDVFNNIIAC